MAVCQPESSSARPSSTPSKGASAAPSRAAAPSARARATQNSSDVRPSGSEVSRHPDPSTAHVAASAISACAAGTTTLSRTSSAEGVAEAVEKAFILAVGALIQDLGQLGNRLAGFLALDARHPHVDDHAVMPAPPALDG